MCGIVGPSPGLASCNVLSTLNQSNEEILRGFAKRGNQTSSHIFYDHIEVQLLKQPYFILNEILICIYIKY